MAARQPVRVFLFTLIFICHVWCSFAWATGPRLTQLAHNVWRSRDGDIPAGVTALAQTSDGYMWIGTDSGLLRFDGVHFTPWQSTGGDSLDPRVFSLNAAKSNVLWVGTGSGLYQVTGDMARKFLTGRINMIARDGADDLWIARTRQRDHGSGFCHMHSGAWSCPSILPARGAAVAVDAEGTPWVVTTSGSVVRSTATGALPYTDTKADATRTPEATIVASGNDGSIVLGMGEKERRPFLRRISKGRIFDTVLPDTDNSTIIQALHVDAAQSVWVGTSNRGLFRISGQIVEHFSERDGLSSDEVTDILCDVEGTMWIATSGGLDSFHKLAVETWSKREGLTADSVSSVFVDSKNKVWLGNQGGLDMIEDGVPRSLRAGAGLPGKVVGPLLMDSHQTLWLGLDSGLWRYASGRFTEVRGTDRQPLGMVYSLAEDTDHSVWARGSGLFHLRERATPEHWNGGAISDAMLISRASGGGVWLTNTKGELVKVFSGAPPTTPTQNGPAKMPVSVNEADGYVWTAKGDVLVAWKDGISRVLTKANGLNGGRIFAAVRDAQQNEWLMTESGYVRISHDDILRWLATPSTHVNTSILGRPDGAQPGFASFDHSAVLAPNGDLWFATDHVAQRIVPSAVVTNLRPPPVLIERIQADDKTYLPSNELRLPARSRDIAIAYTATSFVDSRRVRFRYKLEGWDKDWQDADTRREAFYTNLPPGHYVFRVIAANSSGIWNNVGASTEFNVQPTFYQRRSVRVLMALLSLGLLWLFYRLRLASVHRRVREKAETRMAERERIARDLHDTLLQGTQGLVLRFAAISLQIPEHTPLHTTVLDALAGSEQLLNEGRERIHQLRATLKNFEDFTFSIQYTIRDLERRYSLIPVDVKILGDPRPMKVDLYEQLFLIARELLTNAFKHAHATQIDLMVEFLPDAVHLTVSDDGSTMGQEKSGRDGFGLRGVQERASSIQATFSMDSDGKGTRATLLIPVKRRGRTWNALEQLVSNAWRSEQDAL
ncbi:two-component regulator propeller domain-containing protein [Granulicella cerasi]|uniref:Two-component regulator propeller domain-containing protein n=1 Tax=Granulicella cerasi TaxID=741063 RepID=A0ABW1Z690_9BACT|nr:sensor histidine kinase [Granulicella cerasi]